MFGPRVDQQNILAGIGWFAPNRPPSVPATDYRDLHRLCYLGNGMDVILWNDSCRYTTSKRFGLSGLARISASNGGVFQPDVRRDPYSLLCRFKPHSHWYGRPEIGLYNLSIRTHLLSFFLGTIAVGFCTGLYATTRITVL